MAGDYLKSKDIMIADTASMIAQFKLTEHFDTQKLVVDLVNGNNYPPAKKLVQAVDDEAFTLKIIGQLSTRQHSKMAFKFVKDFGLKEDDFPVLMDIAEEGALNYYISRTMRKSDHIDHLPIYKCEDLFSGMKERLAKLCNALLKKGKIVEAKGIWQRNQLEGIDFDFAGHNSSMKDPSVAPKDAFAPVSVDPKCMKLSESVKVTFVATEDACLAMREVLLTSDFIGMDAEWRPAISRRDKERPALF